MKEKTIKLSTNEVGSFESLALTRGAIANLLGLLELTEKQMWDNIKKDHNLPEDTKLALNVKYKIVTAKWGEQSREGKKE